MTGNSNTNGADGRAAGRLAANVMQFARTLRAAGLPVGPGKVLEALRAVEAVGFSNRQDFYWALHSVFVNRRDQRDLFDQAFHLFWRNPRILDRIMDLLLPSVQPVTRPEEDKRETMSRRLAEAIGTEGDTESEDEGEEEIEIDAALTWSDRELLQARDFEQMSAAELAEAKQLMKGLRLPIMALPTRRFRPDDRGAKVDLRAMLRTALRSGSDSIPLKRRAPQRRHPPLVVLCDISGSMSRYSRMFLHFLHAITNDRDRVHSFVFGTRLTNISRYLRQRDVDVALQSVTQVVLDWSGGTRIGACLADFNRHWSRRVLGQGAVVLLITDGLDRDNAGLFLEREVERLHKSCRRLIWLNPLLRYEGYEPKSQGAKAIIHHVDELRTIHNLESLRQLAEVLSRPSARCAEAATRWQEIAA